MVAVRSTSSVGLSLVYVEFDWGLDIYRARQLVDERITHVAADMPPGIDPEMGPLSSITGQIAIVGLWSKDGKTDPMTVRTLADAQLVPRLESIAGVAAPVISMGGERMQYQVLVDPNALLEYGVTLHEIEQALTESNVNITGGYLDNQGAQEIQIRALGRLTGSPQEVVEQLRYLVVQVRDERPVLLGQVAKIQTGAKVKRGDAAAYMKYDDQGFTGGPAVTLVISKQPGADTRRVTEDIESALTNVPGLPADIQIHTSLYQQSGFIDRAIENVTEALWHGALLVVIVLFFFLLNFRTTFITLTAIPLSIAASALVFKFLGLSINVMTLGGLAVAIGELVDDAIVDVENIFRRLRENGKSAEPRSRFIVVYEASCEIRNSIVFGTLIVVLVFLPLFFLSGMEGRLFTPLGIAYIVSILCSLLVSLTVTPVLSYWLLSGQRFLQDRKEGILLRVLKQVAGWAMSASLQCRVMVLVMASLAVVVSLAALLRMDRNFLPPFNEGTVQINAVLGPGTSIERTREVADMIDRQLLQIEGVSSLVSRSGRAEEDEHAMDANITEIIATIDTDRGGSREEIINEIRDVLGEIPGIQSSTEQPLAHLISHMLTGVKSAIGIKLYGNDLDLLRATAEEIKQVVDKVPGVADAMVEPQVVIPQLQIKLDRHQLAFHGLTPLEVNEFVETALHGRVVSEIIQGQSEFDLLVRLQEDDREDISNLKRLTIPLPGGGSTPLGSVATIQLGGGPNSIAREKVQRRIIIQCNTTGERGLVNVVEDIQKQLEPIEESLPAGYFVEYGGQFESQQSASQTIGLLFSASLVGMFLLLYVMFRSPNFALQVMVALPMAFIGSVAALVVTGQTLTIAAMVGFISLCGIAVRNGILLLNHYLHLVRNEGESWNREMLIRAGKERLA
ncbi:MAG: efflux RND transporter permease subunit, partial [Planctomycetales bacterium]